MKNIMLTQMAQAMGVEMLDLQLLMARCGVFPSGNSLDPEQVQQLVRYLEERKQVEQVRAQEEKERAKQNLEAAVERYVLLVDTCSLLHEQCPAFMGNLVPLLHKHGKALIIPSGVMAELDNLYLKKPELRKQIDELRPHLAQLAKQGLVKVYGDPVDTFGDKQLLEVTIRYMTENEMLVITQDRNLSEDLLNLRQARSVQGKDLSVRRINRFGFLSIFKSFDRKSATNTQWSGWGDDAVEDIPVRIDHRPLSVTHKPVTGDLVHGGTGVIWVLGETISSGGEGNIYRLDDATVAKVYHAGKLTQGQKEKLELMTSMPAPCGGICWPKELLYNQQDELVGYRMDRASGMELQRCVFNRIALERFFPDWTKQDTVQLCVTILEKICALHDRGIILGDINPQNIMVVSPKEVWFVDCDSYQIGGFPCPVGTVRFTAPEIQKKQFSDFLRSRGNEYFGVATLMFMIMLPGKAPYAQRGGEDMGEVIREMQFPYPFGEYRSENTPEGDWRYLWSHMPRYMKEAFFETFQKEGSYSQEKTRLSAGQWLKKFRYYLELLNKGSLQDPESNKIFPSRHKCVNQEDAEVWRSFSCINSNCRKKFDVSKGEWKYLLDHDFPVPSTCPTCRKLKKLEKAGYSFGKIG